MVTTETKPVWTSSSFLIYAGGLTVLEGAIAALFYLFITYSGSGEMTAWSLLIFVILAVIATVLRRADQWIPAGLFAFNSVIAWGILVGVTLHWWGWANGSFRDPREWSWSRLLLELSILLAATVARWRFKFPFIRAISAPLAAFFVTDLVTKEHGNPLAILALLIGLVYLLVGRLSDKPSTFWLHLTAGYLIGIPIVHWCHTSTFDFAVLAFMSLVYVSWAYWTKRSTWAIYGTIGFFIVAVHFIVEAVNDTSESGGFSDGFRASVSELWYIPLAFGLLGFWLVLVGMLGKRKRGDTHARVTTETKPVWTSSSVLVYAGGLTVLLGAALGLVYLAIEYRGYGARAGWTLLFLAIVYGIAHVLRLRGRWLAAGIFAFVSVLVWVTLVILTLLWAGGHPFGELRDYLLYLRGYGTPFSEWSWSRMLLWVLTLAFASFNRLFFKFPFIRLITAVVFWLFLVDLLTSGKGNWFEVLALLTGLGYLLVGHFFEKPSAFWLHLVGGALVGGALLHWFHKTDGDFAAISIFAVLYVLTAYWTKRSSWAVFGTIGFFAATAHYVPGTVTHNGPFGLLQGATSSEFFCRLSTGLGPRPTGPPFCTTMGSPWAPALAYGLLGFFLVALGMLGTLRKGQAPAAVLVTPPPPPAPPAAAVAAEEPPARLEEPPAE